MLHRLLLILLLAVVAVGGCGRPGERDPVSSRKPSASTDALGTRANPIKMAMVPSLDTGKLMASGEKLAELLQKQTGLHFKVSVPTSYAAVIAAMGAGTVDVGWLSPLPYVIAHDEYDVEVVLTTVRNNSTEYWSAIIARADSGITKLSDLKGKKFAYVEPMSTSGCLYVKQLIRDSGEDPEKFFSQVIYAGGHDKVVLAVYNKQVDAGAIYAGPVNDARDKALEILPDVMKKTKVVARSADIPNDTVSVRKEMPDDVVAKVVEGLMKVAESDEGNMAVMNLYGIDGFVKAKDNDYDSVRKVADSEDVTIRKIDQ